MASRMIYVVQDAALVFAADASMDAEFAAAVEAAEERAMTRRGITPEAQARALETGPLVRIEVEDAPDPERRAALLERYQGGVAVRRLRAEAVQFMRTHGLPVAAAGESTRRAVAVWQGYGLSAADIDPEVDAAFLAAILAELRAEAQRREAVPLEIYGGSGLFPPVSTDDAEYQELLRKYERLYDAADGVGNEC